MYQPCLVICVIYAVQVFASRDVRGLSMLRMGKRSYLPPLVPPSYDVPGEELAERQLLGAPRMGKDLEEYDLPRYQAVRVPPVPRLGYEEYVNEIRRELGAEPIYNTIPSYSRQKRSADLTDEHVADVEDTEQLEHTQEKRALPRYGLVERDAGHPFPRLGLRDQPFPRLGLRSFPRLGLRDAGNHPFPRLGLRDSDSELVEEERAFPRYGLRDVEEEEEKRAMSMLRMGKREDDEEAAQKRKMSMLRMGKRKMSMLRMGKRGDMSMLRMGRSQPEEVKRAMSMLRMGRSQSDADAEEEKRAMSMLRMGRSYESEAAKKAMSMLRMGRAMSMLRMGRSPELQHDEDTSPEKRKMSMLRMGRGMSMLRMGKRSVDAEKRAMGMLRMGKKSDQSETQDES